jgi:Arc/MetJ-type ribon-helix-helix transcriptional regulator
MARSGIFQRMVKTLELALAKVASLPEATQAQIGRELIERVDELARLRAELEVGIAQLDSGEGAELDIEALIAELRREARDA